MKRLTLLFFAALISGCSTASKEAKSTHEIWLYEVRTNGNKVASFIVRHELWLDVHAGLSRNLFSDPSANAISSAFTNQNALGGGSSFSAGALGAKVDDKAIEAVVAGVVKGVGKVIVP